MKILNPEPETFPLGFDNNQEKADSINHRKNFLGDIRDAVLKEVVDNVSLNSFGI